MRLLLEEPARIERLRADPARLPAAIEELLRFISPVIHFRRTATRAAVLGGQAIAAGDKVVTFFPSANRDESVFAHPDRLDLARSPNDHIAFGLGVHHCLGAPLARVETLLVLREVLARLRDLEPAGPAVRTRSCLIDGLAHLPVRFTPSASAGA
jgi:cholest-4-en-3-one 26-monooxygenase